MGFCDPQLQYGFQFKKSIKFIPIQWPLRLIDGDEIKIIIITHRLMPMGY